LVIKFFILIKFNHFKLLLILKNQFLKIRSIPGQKVRDGFLPRLNVVFRNHPPLILGTLRSHLNWNSWCRCLSIFSSATCNPRPGAHGRFSLIIDAVSLLQALRADLSSIIQWDAENKEELFNSAKIPKNLYT
jgi:hypothetical protein